MKTRLSNVLAAVLGVATLLGFAPTPAAAQQNEVHSNVLSTINPDFNSGAVMGVGQGQNAVITSLQSSVAVDLRYDTPRLRGNYRVSGYWGDPTANNPYYLFMETYGRHTMSEYNLSRFTWNGTEYEFQTIVNMTLNGSALLIRNDEHTSMLGWTSLIAEMHGAIPFQADSQISVFLDEADRPNFVIDFDIDAIITEQYRPIPTPGTIATFGLGCLAITRRRRH